MNLEKVGRIAFYIGLIISVIAGFANVGYMGILALVVLGIIVGALNVTGKEVQKFLLAAVALLLVGLAISTLGGIQTVGPVIQAIIDAFLAFVAGAALLVGLREIYEITSK